MARLLAFLLLAPASVFAAEFATEPTTDDLLVEIVQDFLHGRFSLGVVAVLILAVGLLRKIVAPKVPFLQGDAGGTIFGFILGTVSVLSAPIAAGQPLTKATLAAAVGTAFAASGGWTTLRRTILVPLLSSPWVQAQIDRATKGIPLGGPILRWLLSRYLTSADVVQLQPGPGVRG